MTEAERHIAEAHVKTLPTVVLVNYFEEAIESLEACPDIQISDGCREEFGMLRRELESREVIRFH